MGGGSGPDDEYARSKLERMRKERDKAARAKRLESRKTSAAKARENKPKKVERVKL